MLATCLLCIGALTTTREAWSEEDLVADAKKLVEHGKLLIETGTDSGDKSRVAEGLKKLVAANKKFATALKAPGLTPQEQKRIEAWVVDVESRIEWYRGMVRQEAKAEQAPGSGMRTGEVKTPPMKPGEAIGAWCRRVLKTLKGTEDPAGKAALIRGLASKGGVVSLPTLFRLFETVQQADVREGVHEALAMVGTYRVAQRMGGYAKKSREKHWDNALAVIYLCLEKPERYEPEKPFLRAVRSFHQLKIRALSLRILEQLDSMDPEGIAALGELVYVEDFGYQSHTIKLLSAKRDTRAVPPLVHLMNRFKFDIGSKAPAHDALLKIGWYAVPELVARLDNKAAGIWISFTLRKITGQTMGTDKRKWHDWWKGESLRHPELFPNPDERPGGSKGPVVTGK